MYPSLIFMPLGQIGFAVINHVSGPNTAIRIARKVADFLLYVVPGTRHHVTRDDVAVALKLIDRFMPRPWIACLETACAFQVWLAMHGENSTVCIGKRIETGRLLMHAWVRSESDEFFADARFEACFDGGS